MKCFSLRMNMSSQREENSAHDSQALDCTSVMAKRTKATIIYVVTKPVEWINGQT